MAASGEAPQGINVEQLMALADGTRLQELGAVTTRIITTLDDALAVARAIEAGNLENLTQALGQTASREDASAVLGELKESLVGLPPLAEPSPLAMAAVSRSSSTTAIGVEAYAQRELAIRLAAREKLPLRQEHRRTAFAIADEFYNGLDYDRAEAYVKQTGHYFHRIDVPSYLYGLDARGDRNQCIFVPTASGREMTLRRLESNTGEVERVGFSLVLKLEPTDDPLRPDNAPTSGSGNYKRFGILYATLTDRDDSTIEYTDQEVNGNAVFAEAADRDLIERFRETADALNDKLAAVVI